MPLPDTLPPDSSVVGNQSVNTCIRFQWLRYIVPLLLLGLILSLMYRDGISWLFEVWGGNAYSHGYLVPFVSLYLVWEQRQRYQMLPVAPAYTEAAIIILFSLALLLISRGSAFIQLEGASLFLIIPGILLLLFGRRITRAALLPWLYLSFALPWFDLFLNRVQPAFQRLTAILGTKLLSLIYPVFLSDIYIYLPSITMEVANECSGVGFFISVLAIGIPLVYLTQRRWSQAVLVLVLGLLITLLANGLRVAMAGIMGENFGPALLHGPSHILQGWFVAWIGWAGIFIVNWLVIKRSDQTAPRLFERWEVHAVPTLRSDRQISTKSLYSASCVLTLCTIVIYFSSPHPVPLPTPLSNLPVKMADWKGAETEWIDKSPLFPGADEQLERVYHSNQNVPPIFLYIAYFNKQTEQNRLISRFSRPLHKKTVPTTLPDSGPGTYPRKINRTTLIQEGLSYDIFFWYQFPARTTVTGQNQARLTALKNGILHRRNNGAAVLVAIPQNTGRANTTAEFPESITAFLQDFYSPIARLIP